MTPVIDAVFPLARFPGGARAARGPQGLRQGRRDVLDRPRRPTRGASCTQAPIRRRRLAARRARPRPVMVGARARGLRASPARSGRSGRATSAPRSPARSARCCRPTGRRSPTSAPPSRRSARPRSRAIARGAWDNLGRTGAEYPHLGDAVRLRSRQRRCRAASRSTASSISSPCGTTAGPA